MTTRHILHTRAARPLTLLGILVVATISAHAQNRSGPIEEVRAAEVFVHIGSFRAASDEGLIGIAAELYMAGWHLGARIGVGYSARRRT